DSLRLKSGDNLLKLNGSALTAQTDAAQWLPVQALEPTTFKLLSGSPEERRQFIDWGVFHVEQKFIEHWKVFRKQLKQRDAALEEKELQWLPVWNQTFPDSAAVTDNYRRAYLKRFKPAVERILQQLDDSIQLTLADYPGWDRDSELTVVPNRQEERDL